MSARKLTDEQIDDARRMREDGMSYQTIADAMNVSREGIRLYLNPEIRKNRAGHYQANRAKVLARVTEYAKTHKEAKRIYDVQYGKENREYIRLRKAEYQQTHKEQIKVHKAEYYRTHKEQYCAYAVEHQAERTANQRLRKALIIGAAIGSLAETAEIYRKAKEDDKVRCYLCGKLIPKGQRHVDHIVPLSKGGQHRASNLAVACDKCNMKKHDKLPEEMGVLL